MPVWLFYDFRMEEGLRGSNPVGRGRYTPGGRAGGAQRGLAPRLTRLPWIPSEQQWLRILEEACREPARNRVMLALAYDAALRRGELYCTYTFFEQCPHRMACAKCDFYTPKDSSKAQILEAKGAQIINTLA